MGESIWECFHVVRDPRVERTRKHELHDILVIAICAVICGAESWNEIEEFGRSNEDWFREFLDLPYGIPSHPKAGRCAATPSVASSRRSNPTSSRRPSAHGLEPSRSPVCDKRVAFIAA